MNNKIEQPVCSYCGSNEVDRDACAAWNIETQQWEMVTVYDNADCEQCQGETSLEMITVDSADAGA